MRARARTGGVKKLLIDSEELQEALSMGKNSALEVAEAAGAVRRFSSRLVRYDVAALQRYFDSMGAVGEDSAAQNGEVFV